MGSGIPFANNWAYLETELNWLERLLLVAISQQRKNLKSVARVAKTPVDKVTSDWWQGLVAIKNKAYDDAAPKTFGERPSLGYQKTLDKRILLSRASKVSLGLPTMQMSLGLSLFEKKLVLMALAPEVQVRYGRLYHYLQTGAHCSAGALPTLELALRVLCRSDAERRRSRSQLSRPNSLLQRQILRCVEGSSTLLGSQLQLAPEWVDYLLAETPDPSWPMQVIRADQIAEPSRERVTWPELIVADTLKQRLQTLAEKPQLRLLLVGEQGVGKEKCAIALATHLKQSLYSLDLAQISPQNWPNCLTELNQATYPVILIKSAHHWLGRNSAIDRAALQHWLTTSSAQLVFVVRHRHLIRHHWRQQLTAVDIPVPNAQLRLQLWQHAFPNGVKSMGKVRWTALAEGLTLSPRQITEVGGVAQTLAGHEVITVHHLQQALNQQEHVWKLR